MLSVSKQTELKSLVTELDMEMDGVRVPASAAAILNSLRRLMVNIEEEED